jgi:hypothetical protein
VRKLDQLRAAHLTQQHTIRLQVQSLPAEIKQRHDRIERLAADIERRDANTAEEFSMAVGGRTYSGKGAREAAAAALTQAVLGQRNDPALAVRGSFRGFDLLSRGRPQGAVLVSDGENLPELLIRGSSTFAAQINPDSPVGTVQSIEHALRVLDKSLADEQARLARAQKMLADFEEQLGRPYEHEAQLKELLAKQAELNAALDLDKGEQQAAAPAEAESGEGPCPNKSRGRAAFEPRRRREEEPEDEVEIEADHEPTVPVGNRNDMRL